MLISYRLISLGFSRIIIRNKEKQLYYRAFNDYKNAEEKAPGLHKNTKTMERILALALIEALHKSHYILESQADCHAFRVY